MTVEGKRVLTKYIDQMGRLRQKSRTKFSAKSTRKAQFCESKFEEENQESMWNYSMFKRSKDTKKATDETSTAKGR